MASNSNSSLALSGIQQAIVYFTGVAYIAGLFLLGHLCRDLSSSQLAVSVFAGALILATGATLIINAVITYRQKS